MQKNRFWMIHVFYLFFPVLALIGGYGFWIFATACSDTILSETASVSVFDFATDPFQQTARFSEADLQDEIATYEYALPTVSPRFGSSASVLSSVLSADSDGQNHGKWNGNPTGKVSVLNSGTGTGSISELPIPPTWNLSSADVWRIETAYASRQNPSGTQMKKLAYYRWTAGVWEKEDSETFYETITPAQPILFYVHGNRTELNTATMQGLQVLKNYPSELPPRLVLWSWNADRVSHRPRIEYATKARYADLQGFYLAKTLKTLTPENHVLLSGHSFGARTVLCALHLLAGGMYGNRTLENTFPQEKFLTEVSWKKSASVSAPTPQNSVNGVNNEKSDVYTLPSIDVFLVAPAVGCTVLNRDSLYGRALEPISHLTLTQNGSDPALKFYPIMYGARNRLPEALGYVGPTLKQVDSELQTKIRVIRVDSPTHQFLEYLQMRSVQNALLF